jgi:hypothetical protein
MPANKVIPRRFFQKISGFMENDRIQPSKLLYVALKIGV